MAWSDVIQGARTGFANSTNILNQRRQNALDRLSQTASDIANRKFTASENAAQREFTAGENALDRANRIEVQKLSGKQSMDVAKFNKTANLELQAIVNQNNQELEGISDANARARLEIEHQNRLDEATQAFLQAYNDFPEGTRVAIEDPTTHVIYYADNTSEVEAFLTKIRETAAAAAAQMYKDDPSKSDWWDAYMQVAPTLSWEGDPNIDNLAQQLRTGMAGANSDLTPEQLDAAEAFFRAYFFTPDGGGGDGGTGGGGRGGSGTGDGETIGERNERIRTETIGGGYGWNIPQPEGEQTLDEAPPIDTIEKPFYDQIKALQSQATTPEQQTQISTALNQIETEEVDQDTLQQLLEDIQLLINPPQTSPRRLNVTPLNQL